MLTVQTTKSITQHVILEYRRRYSSQNIRMFLYGNLVECYVGSIGLQANDDLVDAIFQLLSPDLVLRICFGRKGRFEVVEKRSSQIRVATTEIHDENSAGR